MQDPIFHLASSRRILVLGSSGSGKTTLSISLARILEIETIHLDAHFWKPGWIATPQPEWREIVSSLIKKPSWIMDGTYESTLDLRIPAADSIILIESSRWTCLWRVLKRQSTRNVDDRPDAPKGEKPDHSDSQPRRILQHYGSWLRYIWQYRSVTRPYVVDCIRQRGPDKTMIQLGGSKEIKDFVQQLRQAVHSRTHDEID